MSKIAVVYWSGTGNTLEMAQAVKSGAEKAGAQVRLFTPDEFSPDMVDSYDYIAFGCPSMGCEQLEESEFEPMFSACKPNLNGKPIALFGSYGWGDGEWMRTWEEDCGTAGINRVADSVICCEAPDDEALAACRALGRKLAE